jgi:hypothetical protein
VSTAVLEFRVRERYGQALLLETSQWKPGETDESTYLSILAIFARLISSVEELWQKWEEELERSGLPVKDAGAISSSVLNFVHCLDRCVDLAEPHRGRQPPAAEEEIRARLTALERKALPLHSLVSQAPPEPDLERMRRSQEQMERGEGIDAEELLSQLTQEGKR